MRICTVYSLTDDPGNHDAVITDLESDVLECEVTQVLGSTAADKAGGRDGIPEERFKILNDDVIKELHSIHPQIWKTQRWPQDWKRSILIPTPKEGSIKECSNHQTIALTSHASKVKLCSRSSELRFSITWIENFQMFKLGVEKKEESKIKLPILTGL